MSMELGAATLCNSYLQKSNNTHRWKDYNGRKVWTVNAKDVEYITVELTGMDLK
jgi:hypothetical protein